MIRFLWRLFQRKSALRNDYNFTNKVMPPFNKDEQTLVAHAIARTYEGTGMVPGREGA